MWEFSKCHGPLICLKSSKFFFRRNENNRCNRCFEELERSMEDILSSCFHILYLWTVAHMSPLSNSYMMISLLAFLFLVRWSFCILPVYLGAPYAFNKTDYYLSKKRNENNRSWNIEINLTFFLAWIIFSSKKWNYCYKFIQLIQYQWFFF